MIEKPRRSDCPISLSLDIFGDKWTMLIFRDIIFFDYQHFFQVASQEGISTNILTDRLNRLVSHEILKKTPDQKNHSANIYTLTNKGIELVPMVAELLMWGAKYTENNMASKDFSQFLSQLEHDKKAVIFRLQKKLKAKLAGQTG